MALPEICLGQGSTPGDGGTVSPGQDNEGAINDSGYAVLSLVNDMDKTVTIKLYKTLYGETPSDLEALGIDSLKFFAKEMLHHKVHYIEKDVTIVNPPGTDGCVTLDLDPEDIPFAGMWYAGVVGYNASDQIIAEWPMWLEVRRSISELAEPINTPINIAEVRLIMRDTVPENNNLLLEFEFTDTEIAFHILRPIEEWNEMLPPVATFTGATFPFRENWRKATAGYLMRMAARKYLRDDLQYNAGGLSINDKSKWDAYENMGQKLIDEWRVWAKQKKVQLNSQDCYGRINSRAFDGWRVY
jgi:hypothetical protein